MLVLLVVVWQNTGENLKFQTLLGKAPPPVELLPNQSAPGSFGQVDLMGRFFLRNFEMFKNQPTPIMNQIDNGFTLFADEDRVRLIMLAGEFEDNEAALERLVQLESELIGGSVDPINPKKPDDLILAELRALETIYTLSVDALEPEQRQQLSDRYGLIGKVALTHDLTNTDPLRRPLISGGGWLIGFGSVFLLGVILVPFVGLCLLIFGIIQLATGKLKFRNHVPTKGGSIFLETYALFIGAFLAMSIGTFYVANSSKPELASLSLLVQWLLLLLVPWGIMRGMRSQDWRKAIGWHTGEGVFKEIGCGIIAYIASIPIYLIGVLITVVLLFASEAIALSRNNGVVETPEPLTNPIFEMIASGSWTTTLLLFVLATTWAPIVEEAIFRGALFRHMRSSMHWVLAALASAFLFAYMHDYGPLMVAPLIALGFMFAFMREWRGSLIAPMTAHFLHNFTLMTFMIILVQLIKDPM